MSPLELCDCEVGDEDFDQRHLRKTVFSHKLLLHSHSEAVKLQ